VIVLKWMEVKIHTTQEAIEPVSNILHEYGANGVVIEDPADLFIKEDVTLYGTIYELDPNQYPEEGVYIKAYLPSNDAFEETVHYIKEAVTNLQTFNIDIGKNNVTFIEINEEDWANEWKKYYKPVQISKRITIVPTWENYKKETEDELIIELDPGMAFGTGTHPTTVLSVRALEKYVNKGDAVIDVGSGSGVLSIASALLGAKTVRAFDLDEVAVSSTINNVKLNEVDNIVQASQNDLLQGIQGKVEVIVANILAEIILKFVDDAYELLNDGGFFITSGIIKSKEEDVKNELTSKGFTIIEVNKMEDWIAIVAKK